MRIALIGDSHSQVLWPRLTAGLTAAGHQVVLTEANPGWSEAKYISSGSLPAKLQTAKPDLVVFELGGNNMKMDLPSYQGDPAALIKMAKSSGASVLWLGPPASDASKASSTAHRHETTANMQSSLIRALGASWVDSRPFTVNSQNHQADGVHFNGTGYTAWAKAMLPYILSSKTSDTAGLWAALGGTSVLSLLLVWALRHKKRKSQ
jgi:lysophospholipase L1-like esterase